MIGFLKGTIVWADQRNIILSINGLGYEVNCYNEFTTSDLGKEIALFITQKISEYGQSLFGFKTIEEKIIFESLDSIKGLGSKVVFTIMSELKVSGISDLQNLNLDQLVKLPGVGKSTAQKFLLGLSNKLKKEFDLEKLKETSADFASKYKGEIDLLVEWGMKKSELLDFLKENSEFIEGKSSESIIQLVLKNFRK
jgi:Holliday junction DNA helicase RuvA